jgi:putative oxidoreductase
MKSRIALASIKYVFFFLFLYTSFSKLMAYDFYLNDLRRSPLLSHYSTIIAILVPVAELLVAGLLISDKTSKGGLFGSFILMLLFTLYVCYVLYFTTSRPCSCGGIVRQLTWPQHLLFNLFFLILSIIGIYIHAKSKQSIHIFTGEAENLE